MPLATAITSRAGGRSLAMALRTQNFVGHFPLPPVSPHEDMGRDAISTTRVTSRAGLRGALAHVRFEPKADISPYSIVSSARASTDCGTVIPSAFAVLRLITSSYLVRHVRLHGV